MVFVKFQKRKRLVVGVMEKGHQKDMCYREEHDGGRTIISRGGSDTERTNEGVSPEDEC